MQWTQVPSDAFEKLQFNAGIMVDEFTPSTGVFGNILGATTGGFTFSANPSYTDIGDGMDNVPPNTWQLKRISSFDPTISGTFLTVTAETARMLVGPANITGTKITPANQLKTSDFSDVWVIGDYSDVNGGGADKAGYVAVHLMNALNNAGMQWQTTKDGKGQFSFEFHGHYDLTEIETVPFEIYVKAGTT